MTNVWGVEKFDIIMGNPPYQSSNEGETKTKAIWHLFVNKSLDILIDGGYLNIVHPSGWRNVDGNFKETQNRLKSKEILKLKLHSFKQGQEIFGAAINFDYYTLKNIPNKSKTHIVCVDGSELYLDISKLDFIPDENIINILDLVAKDGEEKVELLFSRSLYGNDKKHMSKTKTETNIFPCVYSVKSPNKNNEIGLWYSSQNNGHFNIPKVIFASGASGVYVDDKGEYGIMNFACGIVDEVENLPLIQKALLNEKFIKNIMGFKASLGDKYNRKMISTFRKDFWKEFIDYGEDYLKSKVENKNILNTYEKLEEKLLTLNEVETDTKKYYKSFAKGKNIFVYCYFLKGHIHINIKRGDIKQDGSKSKGFFTLNDPKNICVDAEYTIKKNGVNGKYHRIVIDETTDIDYVYSLILQKYYSI
jgi:hypothetical protein